MRMLWTYWCCVPEAECAEKFSMNRPLVLLLSDLPYMHYKKSCTICLLWRTRFQRSTQKHINSIAIWLLNDIKFFCFTYVSYLKWSLLQCCSSSTQFWSSSALLQQWLHFLYCPLQSLCAPVCLLQWCVSRLKPYLCSLLPHDPLWAPCRFGFSAGRAHRWRRCVFYLIGSIVCFHTF